MTRIKHDVQLSIFATTAEKECDFDNTEAPEIVLDDYPKAGGSNFTIEGGTSKALDFFDVATVQGYYIELRPDDSDTAVPGATLDVNGLGAKPFAPGKAGVQAKSFHECGPITSLTVACTAAAGTFLRGRYRVWGDE